LLNRCWRRVRIGCGKQRFARTVLFEFFGAVRRESLGNPVSCVPFIVWDSCVLDAFQDLDKVAG
jgi:hypothetical protein